MNKHTEEEEITCCPDKCVSVCSGCDHDYGKGYLFDKVANGRKKLAEEILKDIEEYEFDCSHQAEYEHMINKIKSKYTK